MFSLDFLKLGNHFNNQTWHSQLMGDFNQTSTLQFPYKINLTCF